MPFRNYVLTRRYDFGRSNPRSWEFIARARGDERLMNVETWPDLEKALRQSGAPDRITEGARATWKAYLHRRRTPATPFART